MLSTVLRTLSQILAAQSCPNVIKHTPTHKTLSVKDSSILVKIKTLTTLKTCCQNEKEFEQEFA